jgi:urea transport system substrate-binding protein
MKRRDMLKLSAVAAAAMIGTSPLMAQTKEPIKVGILHSLSGTMAISETSLKDVALMTIDEINKSGGVLGRKLEPVVVDPASNWPLFAEKARQLITKDKVAVTFGCWTSVSRKSVLPVYEEPTRCCSTRCSTKVRRCRRTCSTRARRPTSRRSRPWNT